MDISNYIYNLPISGRNIIYSPLSDTSAFVNESAVEGLKRLSTKELSVRKTIESLTDLFNRIQTVKKKPEKREGEINPEFLGIIPTRSCNGACNYCDFGAENASSQIMPLDIAVKAVDWFTEIIKARKRESLDIHFFGGEPTTAMDVVETVVHRARYNAAEKNLIPYFEILTNGQFTEEVVLFLGDYFNSVILSLDGFEEIQNFHRPLKNGKGSFDNAVKNAKLISESNAQLNIRACISRMNVELMDQIASWFCTEFSPSAINFEVLQETPDTSKKGLFAPDPYKFAEGIIKSKRICDSNGVSFIYSTDISNKLRSSSCPVGMDAAIISPNGIISNCYLTPENWINAGLELNFGSINNDKNVSLENKSLDEIRNILSNKPRCKNCFCRWSCAGGCHVRNTYPGCDSTYNDYCIQTRIISACSLLSGLGLDNEVDTFIKDEKAMKELALQSSDLLFDNKRHDELK